MRFGFGFAGKNPSSNNNKSGSKSGAKAASDSRTGSRKSSVNAIGYRSLELQECFVGPKIPFFLLCNQASKLTAMENFWEKKGEGQKIKEEMESRKERDRGEKAMAKFFCFQKQRR